MKKYKLIFCLIIIYSLISCQDFLDVSNPGPVQDESLNDPAAHNAVVIGAQKSLAIALDNLAHEGAGVAREVSSSGQVGAHGIGRNHRRGILSDNENDGHWERTQTARFAAEDGVRRFTEVVDAGDLNNYEPYAHILLYAGYSNRLLGENMCNAVIDGGPAEPREVWLQRAEAWFTDAISIAENIDNENYRLAAISGRASVRVHLGDWSGAVNDASEIPDNYNFSMPYDTEGLEDNYNRLYWASAGPESPFRAYTAWNTFIEDYYEEYNDQRTPYEFDPDIPTVDNANPDYSSINNGSIPFLRQKKYTSRDHPINLSSGREMRLIEAENYMREGDFTTAMEIINNLRADIGVASWNVDNEEEAWTALKRERFIELWLEGRRLSDLKRWNEEQIPGAHDTEDNLSEADLPDIRDTCFPIPPVERETNPNID